MSWEYYDADDPQNKPSPNENKDDYLHGFYWVYNPEEDYED